MAGPIRWVMINSLLRIGWSGRMVSGSTNITSGKIMIRTMPLSHSVLAFGASRRSKLAYRLPSWCIVELVPFGRKLK